MYYFNRKIEHKAKENQTDDILKMKNLYKGKKAVIEVDRKMDRVN